MKKYDFITKEYLIKEYSKTKKSKKQVANKAHCSETNIRNRLIKYNIKIRTSSETRKDKFIGKNCSAYIDGRTLKKYYCIDCLKEGKKTEINYQSALYGKNRCKKHASEGNRNGNFGNKGEESATYIDGRAIEKHYCIMADCNNKISYPNWLYGNRTCIFCASKKENNPFFGKKHTKETRKIMSLIQGGTGVPYEFNEYPEEFFRIRYWILKRDNHICQKCGKYTDEVHHIDYNKQNNKKNNLIALCHKCNMKANFNRDYWFAYYTYLMEDKNK